MAFFDELITSIADPEKAETERRQKENAEMLTKNAERLLAQGNLNPSQKASLQRMIGDGTLPKNLSYGATETFVTEYGKTAKDVLAGVVDSTAGTVLRNLPWYVWVILIGIGFIALQSRFKIIKTS